MANSTAQTEAGSKVATWKIDPAHSTVEFIAKHMMITSVRGRFPDVEGTIRFDEENIANSQVEATIQVGTVTSGSERRDQHLRTGDFFLVDEHPTFTFKSTRIEPKGGDEYKITGDLTIRGVTKQVTLDTTFEGRNTSPWGTEAIGFSAATTINRKDFGVNWNVGLEAGGVMVSDKIKLELNIEAVKNVEQAGTEAEAETKTSATA